MIRSTVLQVILGALLLVLITIVFHDLFSHNERSRETEMSSSISNDKQRTKMEKSSPSAYQHTESNWDEPRNCHPGIADSEKWSPPSLPETLQNADQDDAELISRICHDWLLPPFTSARHLQFPDEVHYSQKRQSEVIDMLLKRRERGFFIESGAAEGERISNSLFFEKSRNWRGLLVEPNPDSFDSVLGTRRHAYMVNACLSPTRQPMRIQFQMAGVLGGLVDYMGTAQKDHIDRGWSNDTEHIISVQCLPLYSILRAMGVSHVDYFSLDIEGAELDVLKTLPLDEITVDVFSIEYVLPGDKQGTKEKLMAILDYLVFKNGYTVAKLKKGELDIILTRNNIIV